MTATATGDDLRLDEPAGDAVLGWLEEARTVFGWLAAGDGQVDAATRMERIAVLEKIKAAAASAQLAEVVRFTQSQLADQHADGWITGDWAEGSATRSGWPPSRARGRVLGG